VYDFTFSILDRAAGEYRALAIDRPGFGYSEALAEKQASPVAQARALHGAAEALGLERPVLVAHSRGGAVALAYALDYPEDVAGVVTLAGAPYWHGEETPLYSRVLAMPIVGPLVAHTAAVPLGGGAVRAGLDAAFAPEGTPPGTAPDAYVEAYAAQELRPR
jgi:pimeloyl-ACP methyl ester carboxylesterase